MGVTAEDTIADLVAFLREHDGTVSSERLQDFYDRSIGCKIPVSFRFSIIGVYYPKKTQYNPVPRPLILKRYCVFVENCEMC